MRTAEPADGSSHTQILQDQEHTDSETETEIQKQKYKSTKYRNTGEAKRKYWNKNPVTDVELLDHIGNMWHSVISLISNIMIVYTEIWRWLLQECHCFWLSSRNILDKSSAPPLWDFVNSISWTLLVLLIEPIENEWQMIIVSRFVTVCQGKLRRNYPDTHTRVMALLLPLDPLNRTRSLVTSPPTRS